VPTWRGKEILELIKDGAQDVSISRPVDKLKWGVPVPGDDTQVMYVWVDALSNYITALGYPDENWQSDFWPAAVEIVGKDILRFHSIIWIAMLLALGLEPPKKLLAHGFVNVDGSKMSKSLGNVVSPLDIIENYGADAFRYYFSRHVPTFEDGDFTWEKFEAAYNGELANDLGNLISRSANMIKKYEIKRDEKIVPLDNENLVQLSRDYHANLDHFEFNRALEIAWEFVQLANQFIDAEKPWQLAKTDPEKLAKVLNQLWAKIILISVLLRPFLPDTAAKIAALFQENNHGATITGSAPILFPKKYLHTEEPSRK
jgi:methionyl-tRNA synthetase